MLTTPDHSDAASALPAMEPVGPKPSGFWLDCDPGTGQAGTRFRAEEFNEAAINLRRFLSAAGVVPAKGSPDMLLGAVNRLFAGRVTAIVATQPLTADHAGLVIVDATSGDVTLTLPDADVLPAGSPAFSFVRTDATTRSVRIVPAAGDVIRGGAILLESEPAIIRSDGVSTWWPLTRAGAPIKRAVTLNVSPTGVPEPVDPLGGDPFNDLGSAVAWLAQRSIISPGLVTIQIAAGTYTRSETINWGHPNGDRVRILGAGSATTILQFNGCSGLFVRADLSQLGSLTIRGDASAGWHGMVIPLCEINVLGDLVVDNFKATGIFLEGAIFMGPTGVITVKNCGDTGIGVSIGGCLTAFGTASVVIQNSGTVYGGLVVEAGATVRLANLSTTGGVRGVWLSNRAAAMIGNLTVVDTSTTDAVRVENGSYLGCDIDGRAWVARNAAGSVFYAFLALEFGQINTRNALHASNKTLTNPTQNVVGNTQSIITTR